MEEQNKPEMFEMYIESEIKFVAQFDPSSETYHNGDPTPVPLGGDRVPESMPTVYNEYGIGKDTPMDPDYYYLIEVRSLMMEFKKFVSQVCPAVEAIFRAQKFKDLNKRQNAMIERQRVLYELLEQIQGVYSSLRTYGNCVPDYGEMLKEVFVRAMGEFSNDVMYKEFVQFMAVCTQKIFKDCQDLMKKLKSLN